ncbi:TRAP transporter substrate-binding protein [Clostridium sp. BL-8]|uniref:TRAP transporter substrate-binding protein n=1 Tax=Clostridium sp. BL-8 TaxID=349938 RepID=UPI00098BEC38|nr:TRAP transporter substrate-binding protein [Clostridium sp. BL-8]OOM78983.1 2,3-diketo-L-gulonate-binding periplasmic protein YiaO precursor [Clostridium sp. BL-8]
MSKKKIIALISCVMFTIGVISGCGNKTATTTSTDTAKQETPAMTLRMADNQPEGYPTVLGDREFAKQLEEKTNGRIKVEVYIGGQLGDENSTTEQVQFGAIDAIRTSCSQLAQFNNLMGAVAQPYLFKDKDQMFRALEGDAGKKLLDSLESDSKMVGLAWLDAGSRNFYNTKKDVKTPDDLKGLKIRVQESKPMLDLVQALGASPTPMAYGDVYSALQTGVIDGAENNWPSYLSTNHYEVATHITVDEHTRVPELMVMSKMTWDKISTDDQKLVVEAAKAGAEVEKTEWLKQEKEAEDKIAAAGKVTITKLDDKQAFQDKVKSLYDQHPEWKEITDLIINTK